MNATGPFALGPGVEGFAVRTPTLPPATHTNAVIVGARSLWVFDPASPWADEQAALDAYLEARLLAAGPGAHVAGVVLTHHHADHVGGATAVATRFGAPILAHAATAALLPRLPVVRSLADGETLEVDAGEATAARIRAVFTPGHAPGHLAFVVEGARLLIAGDMVAGTGTILIDPDEGDMGLYLASLERLRGEASTGNAARFVPSHGPPIDAPVELCDRYRAHRLWREERVAEALVAAGAAGATPLALVPRAYSDTPEFLYPLAERSLRAHLQHLAALGRARHGGDGDWYALS